MQIVVDFQDQCGEGPLWDAEDRVLYWVDLVGLRFHRYNPQTSQSETLKSGLEICSFCQNQPGGFVIGNSNGLWIWNGAGEPESIVSEVAADKLHLNDSTADPAGRVWTGSQFYDPAGEYPLGKLFRIDTAGRATVMDEGFHLSNGLAFSPDHDTLYFTDSIARRIYAYDYDVESGDIRGRRVLVQVPGDEGLPDGLAVDAEGFLWSAQWYGSCVVRYDPEGKTERRISTPAKQTSSVTFGGEDLTDLYITSAAASEPMPVMPPGYDPQSGFFGGPLYRTRAGVKGLPRLKANIRLR